MKRAIGSSRRQLRRKVWRGGDGSHHRPHAVGHPTLEVCREGHLPECAREDTRELVRVAGEVVVEVRQADRDVLVEDRLDLRAGRLLGVDADRLLELRERRIEVGRRVLGRVPDAVRLERGVEVDVRRRAVAVVDDAELGRTGARRVGRVGRAPLGAVERVEALDLDVQGDPGLLGLALEERGEVRDLLELAGVQGRRQVADAGRRRGAPWPCRCPGSAARSTSRSTDSPAR